MTYEEDPYEEEYPEYDFEEEEKLPDKYLGKTTLERVFLGSLLMNYEDNAEEAVNVFEEYPYLRECFNEEEAILFDKIKEAYFSSMTRPDVSLQKSAELQGEAALENNIPLPQLAYFLMRRQTVRSLSQMAADMRKPTPPDRKIIDKIMEFEEAIHNASRFISKDKKPKTIKEIMTGLPEKMTTRSDENAVDVGHKKLGRTLGNVTAGDLLIIAGRPAMGKTAFAIDMMLKMANARVPILMFSLEMPSDQVGMRALANISGVSMRRMRDGKLSEKEARKLEEATKYISDFPLCLNDSSYCSVEDIRRQVIRFKRTMNIKCVIVDYLHLLRVVKKKANRAAEIASISLGLKNLAKELSVTVIALSQLSRGVDYRDNKRPVLSDLRESGTIEQDADYVVFLYREEYYGMQRGESLEDYCMRMEGVKGKAEVAVAKNRHGGTGRVLMSFEPSTGTFKEIIDIY